MKDITQWFLGFASESKGIWRETGVILVVILQTIEMCFVDIFGATKVKYSRFVSDCLLMFLCYLKWKSDYRDEELFPGVDSEIPDKILKSLQASRDKGKRWKVLFDIVSILPHYYVQEAFVCILPQHETICLNLINLRLRLLYIVRLPKLFETLDHLLQGEFYTMLRMMELSIYIFLEIFSLLQYCGLKWGSFLGLVRRSSYHHSRLVLKRTLLPNSCIAFTSRCTK